MDFWIVSNKREQFQRGVPLFDISKSERVTLLFTAHKFIAQSVLFIC